MGAGGGVLLLGEGLLCSVLPICSRMPAVVTPRSCRPPRPWHSAASSLLLLRLPGRHLRDQLMDEERTDALIHEHNGLYVDFSRQNINETTMQVRSWGRGQGAGAAAAAPAADMKVQAAVASNAAVAAAAAAALRHMNTSPRSAFSRLPSAAAAEPGGARQAAHQDERHVCRCAAAALQWRWCWSGSAAALLPAHAHSPPGLCSLPLLAPALTPLYPLLQASTSTTRRTALCCTPRCARRATRCVLCLLRRTGALPGAQSLIEWQDARSAAVCIMAPLCTPPSS